MSTCEHPTDKQHRFGLIFWCSYCGAISHCVGGHPEFPERWVLPELELPVHKEAESEETLAERSDLKYMDFDGPCPFLMCVKRGPHKHLIYPKCRAVRAGNILCDKCRELQPIEKEMNPDPWEEQ